MWPSEVLLKEGAPKRGMNPNEWFFRTFRFGRLCYLHLSICTHDEVTVLFETFACFPLLVSLLVCIASCITLYNTLYFYCYDMKTEKTASPFPTDFDLLLSFELSLEVSALSSCVHLYSRGDEYPSNSGFFLNPRLIFYRSTLFLLDNPALLQVYRCSPRGLPDNFFLWRWRNHPLPQVKNYSIYKVSVVWQSLP